jgi:tetratricopeptide (TPR) repeat protein
MRLKAVLGLLIAWPLVAAAAAAEPPRPMAPLDPDVHYGKCLDAARQAPKDGLAQAEDWHNDGGGFPADHCAAVALFGLKRFAEAAQRFEALAGAMMKEKPALRAGALEQAGQAWLLAGDAKRARQAFDAALSYTPKDPDLFIDRGRADAEAQDFKTALADLDRALALAPARADALIYRGAAYRQLDQLDRARTDIDAALKAVPDNVDGLLERGNIRRLAGDAPGAGDDWRRVQKLAPNSPAAVAAKANLARLAADAKK